jgi:hypothetical protein
MAISVFNYHPMRIADMRETLAAFRLRSGRNWLLEPSYASDGSILFERCVFISSL